MPDSPDDAPIGDDALLHAWREALGLERWYFIARGVVPEVTPYVGMVGEDPTIFTFTTPEGAREFGLRCGLAEQEAGQLLAVPTTTVVEWVVGFLEQGVTDLVLDTGTEQLAVALAALPHVAAWAKRPVAGH